MAISEWVEVRLARLSVPVELAETSSDKPPSRAKKPPTNSELFVPIRHIAGSNFTPWLNFGHYSPTSGAGDGKARLTGGIAVNRPRGIWSKFQV
ncbi:hypothetical protein ACFLTZ_06970 [Chloroflexota bacterium]